jgi:sugar phosphate isomerase/epimerase
MSLMNDFLARVNRASHIHVHDNNGLSDQHLALGEGTIDWSNAGKIISRDYSGVVVIEGRSIDEAKKSMLAYRRYFS